MFDRKGAHQPHDGLADHPVVVGVGVKQPGSPEFTLGVLLEVTHDRTALALSSSAQRASTDRRETHVLDDGHSSPLFLRRCVVTYGSGRIATGTCWQHVGHSI